MKIGIFITGSISTNRTDQWVTGRCEARAGINAGYGFALLGHEVDIVSKTFDDAPDTFPGVSLRKHWNHDVTYDMVWMWRGDKGVPFDNYKRAIFMVEGSSRKESLIAIKDSSPKGDLYTLSRKYLPLLKEKYGIDLKYFPILFPIPCLPGLERQDFLDFKFDKDKKDVNVWVFLDAWPNYHINCNDVILTVLRRFRDFYGFKMNVSVHKGTGNKFPVIAQTIITEFSANVLENANLCYLDMLNTLSANDICITKGAICYCGNCSYDIISLGKLMIYTTEGKLPNNINDIYPLDNYVIRHEDPPETRNEKIDRILADPAACYNAMKNELITYSFPEWSKVVTKILEENS